MIKISKMSISKTLKFFITIILLFSLYNAVVFADSENGNAKIITDQRGESVQVPSNPERIAVVDFGPLVSYICLLDNSVDRIAGMSTGMLKIAKRGGVITEIFPDILSVTPLDNAGSTVNIEEVVKINPDLVITGVGGMKGDNCQIFEKVGIPAIGIANTANTDEELYEQIRLIGTILDKEDKANALIEKTKEIHDEIQSKTKSISEESKPGVLILTNKELLVSGGALDSFQDYSIRLCGGHNVMEEIPFQSTTATMEEIIKINPDIILIGGGGNLDLKPDDLYSNLIDGQDWSSIRAVQNKQVYMYPNGDYMWYGSGPQTYLLWEWMADVLQPELFSYDVRSDVKALSEQYYGYTLSEEQIEKTLGTRLNPSLTI